MSPLWQLCYNGNLEGVKAAIANGEDVNGACEKNITGLIYAARRGHTSVVEVLLQQASLDINSNDNYYGCTVIFYTCIDNNVNILKMLLGDPRLTSINTRDPKGLTPLMVAVYYNYVQCVKELVKVKGVDLVTEDGKMSLEEVARWVMFIKIYEIVTITF